jgi:hypothetical protein
VIQASLAAAARPGGAALATGNREAGVPEEREFANKTELAQAVMGRSIATRVPSS